MMNRTDGLTFSQVSEDFLQSLKHERGCAKSTCITYASWLHHYRDWLASNGRDTLVSTAMAVDILRSYQYHLSRRGLRPRTIRAALQPLRSLGDFLVSTSVLPTNTAKALTMPKKDAAVRLTVSDEEIIALLDGATRMHPPRRGALTCALIFTLVYSGIRFQELLDLKVCHVNTSEGTLLVANGKGSKSRLLYPPKECMDAIEAWLKVRGECSHDWLWAENKGRRTGDMGVRDLLEEVKAIAGLRGRENIKPHSLRHAFATRMLQNGASIKAVQSALGHADLKTTAIYVHLSEQETKKMAQFATVNMNPASSVTAPAQTTNEKPSLASFQQSRRRTSSGTGLRRDSRE